MSLPTFLIRCHEYSKAPPVVPAREKRPIIGQSLNVASCNLEHRATSKSVTDYPLTAQPIMR